MHHPFSSSPGVLDQCLLSHQWLTPTELENMSADDKRNVVISNLHLADHGNVSELQGSSNQQLVDLCSGLPHHTRLPPNRPCPPSTPRPLPQGHGA